jgi:DUF971 family protein
MSQHSPTAFRALREARLFEITWSDGRIDRLPFFDVRCACPCASCIHEVTGEPLLNPNLIPPDIAPVELSHSGNYAVKIVWSDGHASGIYTWDHLRRLGDVLSSN